MWTHVNGRAMRVMHNAHTSSKIDFCALVRKSDVFKMKLKLEF